MSPRSAHPSAFDDLAWTAQSGAPGLARATFKVQSELFLQGAEQAGDSPRGTDTSNFLQLAMTLLPLVDETTARDVAHKLCPHPGTPAELIDAFCARGGGVAETAIEYAHHLSPETRHAVLDHSDPRLPARLAGRQDVTADEQVRLIGRAEPAVLLALAANQTVQLSRPVVAGLIASARHDEQLAHSVLARSDIDIVALTPLYLFASAEQRQTIRTVIGRRISQQRLGLPRREATETERTRLLDASLEGMAALIADLALISDRGPDFVEAAVRDSARELVALALMGIGLPAEDTTRMLLRTGDTVARDSRALHALVDIIRSTDRSTAEMIIGANWPKQADPSVTQHVPYMSPGGTPSRAAGAASRNKPAPSIVDQLRALG